MGVSVSHVESYRAILAASCWPGRLLPLVPVLRLLRRPAATAPRRDPPPPRLPEGTLPPSARDRVSARRHRTVISSRRPAGVELQQRDAVGRGGVPSAARRPGRTPRAGNRVRRGIAATSRPPRRDGVRPQHERSARRRSGWPFSPVSEEQIRLTRRRVGSPCTMTCPSPRHRLGLVPGPPELVVELHQEGTLAASARRRLLPPPRVCTRGRARREPQVHQVQRSVRARGRVSHLDGEPGA